MSYFDICSLFTYKYTFAGILSPKTGESPLEEWVGSYKERVKCFKTPHYVNLKVDEILRMPYDGWTNITSGMNSCKYGQVYKTNFVMDRSVDMR